MHEEASIFKAAFEWFKDNFEWFSWLAGAVGYLMYKVHRYFSGLNRLADSHDRIVKELSKMAEKQEKMVDADGVDQRVEPVIETVKTIQGQISQIHEHLLSSNKKRRQDDFED